MRVCSIFGLSSGMRFFSAMDSGYIRLRAVLEIHRLISEGVRVFITGIEPGIDLWCVYTIIQQMDVNPDIQLVIVARGRLQPPRLRYHREKIMEAIRRAQKIAIYPRRMNRQRIRDVIDASTDVLAVYPKAGRWFPLAYAQESSCTLTHLITDDLVSSLWAAGDRKRLEG